MLQGAVSRGLVIIGGAWVGLCASAFIILTGLSLFNLIAGKPAGEAIVMAPLVFVVLSACSLPGACLVVLGWLLGVAFRRRRAPPHSRRQRGSGRGA
jgi:hypothetical protein